MKHNQIINHIGLKQNASWKQLVTRLWLPAMLVIGMYTFGTANTAHSNPQTSAANNLITTMMYDVESYLANDSGNAVQRSQYIARLMDTYFDLSGIARFSAGTYWRAATPDERERYTKIMRQVMISTVTRNFDQLAGFKFTAIDTQKKGEKLVLVRGTFNDILNKRPNVSVGWRVITPVYGQAKVLDVEIENNSMLFTQKQENVSIIRRNQGNFSALIDAMSARQAKNLTPN